MKGKQAGQGMQKGNRRKKKREKRKKREEKELVGSRFGTLSLRG